MNQPTGHHENPDLLLVDWLASFSPASAARLNEFLADNPGRISRGYADLLVGEDADGALVAALLKTTREISPDEPRPGTVVLQDIDFISLCPHHFLPYFGTASISYRPTSRILGLGKFPRVVEILSRRLVIQEDLTRDVARLVGARADSDEVMVVTEAMHTCVCYRGASAVNTRTRVSYSLNGSG